MRRRRRRRRRSLVKAPCYHLMPTIADVHKRRERERECERAREIKERTLLRFPLKYRFALPVGLF